MIRDMETLLNTVQTPEIKEYLTEALICYSNGAYRAAVIIAMIGGIHDLHNKIKDLSPSNKAIADLEKEVSRKKDKLQPYERFLIDQCATSAIDVLNANEAKELNRCFDIRNDCAHPSDYNCSAETARYVFSTIIDILASKPVLLGQQHIKKITEDINSDRFFPCIEKEEIQKIVVARLDTYSNRICKPLAQALVKQIQIDTMQGNFNKTYFLANMYDKIPYDFDSIISPLLMSSQYNTHIMYMLWANETLIKYLSEENLKRLLKIFPMYIQGNCGYNQIVQSVVLSKKLSSSVFDNDIKELLNSKYAGMSDNESDIWIYCISHMSNSSRDTLIKNDYCNNIQNCSKRFKTRSIAFYHSFC